MRTLSNRPYVCPHCGHLLADSPPAVSPALSNSAAPALILVETRHKISLPPFSPIYLGRRDEEQGLYPHIDFTEEGGVQQGVSRCHACIHQTPAGIYIQDLDSTNGTSLNGQSLAPSQLYALEHGDMLQLGDLKLAVDFS